MSEADAKGLDAELVTDDVEARRLPDEAAKDVVAAGERIGTPLSQREPSAGVVAEGLYRRVGREARESLLERRPLLHRHGLSREIAEPFDRAALGNQQRLRAGVVGDAEVDRALALARMGHRGR